MSCKHTSDLVIRVFFDGLPVQVLSDPPHCGGPHSGGGSAGGGWWVQSPVHSQGGSRPGGPQVRI